MPEYLAPGVYVEEQDRGPIPIEGVSTSTAGFIGLTRRGPSLGKPRLITSFPQFEREFGSYFDFGASFAQRNYLPHAVNGFFENGGRRLFVLRVKATGATAATAATTGGLITRLRAGADAPVDQTAAGVVPQRAKFRPATLRGIQDGTEIRLRMVKDGVIYQSDVVTVIDDGVNRSTGEITVEPDLTITPAGPTAFEARYTTVITNTETVTAPGLLDPVAAIDAGPRPPSITIKAKDEGSWGRDIVVQPSHQSAARSEMDGAGATAVVSNLPDNIKIRLKSTAGFYINAWVEIDRGEDKVYRKVKAVDGPMLTLLGPALPAVGDLDPQAPATTTVFSTAEFQLTVTYGAITEQFPGLTLENVFGRYYVDVINNRSNLISVDALAAGADTNPFIFPSAPDGASIRLTSAGSDGTGVTDNDYRGVDGGPGNRTGLRALEDIDQISIIAVPGVTSQAVQSALIEQCERLKDRFAILDPEPGPSNAAPTLDQIQNQRLRYDTKYAAIYYPRLLVFDPLTLKEDLPVPPSGHMAGIYARTDIDRGVHKAPANEVIRAITGLELTVNKEAQEILNPHPININVLRDFRADGRGYRVWGARCITSNTMWKYINVRRLFIYLEESLDEGTQPFVFEPNDERLWVRVKQTVTQFLLRVWRDGALMGLTQEEAFFVKCDRATMTQDDIDNGRLIILIGVAPVKPAEFVIIRIFQKVGGADIEEV